MRKKKHEKCGVVDKTRLLSDLQSSDETVRLNAARSLCPCRAGWEVFEQYMGIVAGMKKDPSPEVRAVALHLFQDADEMDSSSYPTHRREVFDEMLRTKRSSRIRPYDEELAMKQKEKLKGRHKGTV